METLLLVLCIGLLVLAVLLWRRTSARSGQPDQSLMLMQQNMEALRSELRESLQGVSLSVDRQLAHVAQQLNSQTGTVGSRLEGATRAIMDVQRNLGELGRATEEIKELGSSVATLDELLRAPKLRGGLGEFLLEELLRNVLPRDAYDLQFRFRNGQIVDAVIYTADRRVSVDSKFPLENFRKMLAVTSEAEAKSYRKAFAADVRKHIDAIAERYILPDEGTFPFALMYIPAESIFYEVIAREDSADLAAVHAYALERKIIPVSPNSLYAYLQVIVLGLRGLRVEERAREIMNILGRLDADIARVREAFDTLGTHIENARKKYDEADRSIAGLEYKLASATDRMQQNSGQARSDVN